MHCLPLVPDKKQKEWEKIHSIAKNNNFPRRILHKLNHQIQSKIDHTNNGKRQKIWTTFTYHSPKIRRITNLFKNTNLGSASYLTYYLASQLLMEKPHNPAYK
jgi:hypothetical protein